MSKVKIVVHAPLSHADIVRKAAGEAGGGVYGNYSFCSFSIKGKGRFIPGEGAKPAIGEIGKLEEVEEESIEFICDREKAKEILEAIRKVHPYEEMAVEITELMDEEDL
jgi:hypothetical protein